MRREARSGVDGLQRALWAVAVAAAPAVAWAEDAAPAASVEQQPAVVAPAAEPVKIRDNLFLLEEAYNQEPGVVQHVQTFQLAPRTRAWTYSFTDEWPVPTDRHQLSVTLPLQAIGEANAAALGDVLVNYRLQAVGMGGEGPVAFAPRLSLVLPTGDYRTGAGRGVLGVQANLPLSIELGEWFVTHLNAGLTVTPGAHSQGGAQATAVDVNAGAALVWLPLEWFNVLVETAYLSPATVQDDGSIDRGHAFVVNPGVRFALTFPFGLQIVPGVSAPVQVSADGVEVSAMAYLSFEHTLWK